jgi:hypothetical protein
MLIALVALGAAAGAAQEEAVTTRVVVRVVARDAKIIGSGVGGAEVTIVNAETGEILASGVHEGGTGNTNLIMSTPHARDMTVYDTEGAAGFVADLQLSEPTVVNISAVGPLGYPQATRSATRQMLLVPGSDIVGDGVILELYGFIVEIEDPDPMTPVEGSIDVRVRVRMMCGCSIEPGGMWDANTKQVMAHLMADGKVVSRSQLEYAGQTNMFKGRVPVPRSAAGKNLELEVVVSDPSAGNFGRHVLPLGTVTGNR